MKKNVLVLCTGNSCRSQIAEAYLRHFGSDKINVYSAGVEVHGLNPKAVEVLKADDIDIAHHTSNHIDEYKHILFDIIITVCDNAKESCPVFTVTGLKLHHNFPDPAKFRGTEEEVLAHFHSVRLLIKDYCANFVANYL